MAINSSRLPSTVQIDAVQGTAVALPPPGPVPLRPQVFHPETLATPIAFARQLNSMQAELHDATLPSRTNTRNHAVTFEGLVAIYGTPVHIHHKLNGKVRWAPVRWYSSGGSTANLVEATDGQKDPNELVLNPMLNTLAKVDIEVWLAG